MLAQCSTQHISIAVHADHLHKHTILHDYAASCHARVLVLLLVELISLATLHLFQTLRWT